MCACYRNDRPVQLQQSGGASGGLSFWTTFSQRIHLFAVCRNLGDHSGCHRNFSYYRRTLPACDLLSHLVRAESPLSCIAVLTRHVAIGKLCADVLQMCALA